MNQLEPAPAPLTDQQRQTFLTAVADGTGTREALHAAGIHAPGATTLRVTRAQARRIVEADPDLLHDYQVARKRDPELPESVVFEVMADKDNPRRLDAAKFWLERRHPDYRQHTSVDVNHTGQVDNPDLAAAVDRFTALADAAVRAASRQPAGPAALEPD